jgi:NADPH-dependent 2,4-dienoyl-CoA reductase/sulfur reductase-like enzyme/nitrite reductase/ring-hydroxylating ferredoxin subunit
VSDEAKELKGPDLAREGLAEGALAHGKMALGHANGAAVLLIRTGADVFAMGATCTHYGGPLAEGVFDGEGIRCPWHHACFSVRTGAASRPPALNPVKTFEVMRRDGRLFVGNAISRLHEVRPVESAPESVIIVGGGAAGNSAAETLRAEGYTGVITLISADPAAPYDRPNLSKDYLAGTAPEDWLPLRSPEFYKERGIELLLGRRVTSLDTGKREVILDDGRRISGGAILLATGADPVHLDLPGANLPHVHYLRSLADSRAIIAAAENTRRAVVVGASFIGLEVAASLVTRGLEVHVVAPEAIPMARMLGEELGSFVHTLHEEHGVHFHLQQTVVAIEAGAVTLKDGSQIECELVVLGVGVRPSLELAGAAGLKINRGVVVDEFLETSAPGIWAAGDIARWPDPHSGQEIRVEHWVVAQRQGQTAARNILGRQEPFNAVPFFWSQHYDVPINYVGHAEEWDRVDVSGSIADRDCLVAFRKDGKTVAMASIYRDRESLEAELAVERRNETALRQLVGEGGRATAESKA